MKRFGGPVTPFGGRNASPGDNDEYALWDAAYVLGSLLSAERSEYQAHENLPVMQAGRGGAQLHAGAAVTAGRCGCGRDRRGRT